MTGGNRGQARTSAARYEADTAGAIRNPRANPGPLSAPPWTLRAARGLRRSTRSGRRWTAGAAHRHDLSEAAGGQRLEGRARGPIRQVGAGGPGRGADDQPEEGRGPVRRCRHTMRETQREALRLFRERGFAQVTVEEIARGFGMAASTIFRHFGTKEAIVVWDEYDSAIDRAIAERFASTASNRVRSTFSGTSRRDAGRPLRAGPRLRARLHLLIYQTEALHAAAVEAQFADRDELTTVLTSLLSPPHKTAAPILAGAALLALDVAIERWQDSDGADDLATLIHEAFATLERLSTVR